METDISEIEERVSEFHESMNRSLFKRTFTNSAKKKMIQNFSFSILPGEVENMLFDDTAVTLNDTAIDSYKQADKTKPSLDSLCVQFFEIWQSHRNDLLENIKDLALCCQETLSVIKQIDNVAAINNQERELLENEYNTWRLLHILYTDRLHTLPENEMPQYIGLSEKLCALNLFKRDNLVRESQLVIDWLEASYAMREEVLNCEPTTVGWENTLHELKSKETIAFKSTRPIVTKMDPDAPNVQGLPLHDLDMENEKNLCRKLFQEIRCGKLSEAQQFCIDSGHGWRAALLEGWRLHHDPHKANGVSIEDIDNNQESMETAGSVSEKSDENDKPEGNEVRDIWKLMAFGYCGEHGLNIHEKAAVGAYCGHLKSMLAVGLNWEDYLWTYMKVMIDIRVESEIRDCVDKQYKPMPDEYWDQRMSLNDIFLNLERSRKQEVCTEATDVLRVIQKYIILDDTDKLFSYIDEVIEDYNVTTNFLRLLVHLSLFLNQIGSINRRETVEKLLEIYIKRLAEMNETQLVAFYVSKINTQTQVHLYASYLENILNNDLRKMALTYADENELNVFAITKQIVENIRNKPYEVEQCGELQAKLTDNDELKISALDWVLFYEPQRLEALIQCNALIFAFLTLKKLDAAQLAFNKIPLNAVEYIMSEGEFSQDVDQVIKEYLSYRAYLDAQTAFNSWFKQYNMKPLPPQNIPENAQFTEKVAYQHRMSQFKAETERWKLTMADSTKTTKTFLYNVLLFPDGGWLSGAKDGDFLRSLCIPECVLLLYNVLSESNLHEECLQLADILVAEKSGLYKVYSKEKLGEILMKLSEISVALLKEKKDPWGNPTSN